MELFVVAGDDAMRNRGVLVGVDVAGEDFSEQESRSWLIRNFCSSSLARETLIEPVLDVLPSKRHSTLRRNDGYQILLPVPDDRQECQGHWHLADHGRAVHEHGTDFCWELAGEFVCNDRSDGEAKENNLTLDLLDVTRGVFTKVGEADVVEWRFIAKVAAVFDHGHLVSKSLEKPNQWFQDWHDRPGGRNYNNVHGWWVWFGLWLLGGVD